MNSISIIYSDVTNRYKSDRENAIANISLLLFGVIKHMKAN
jgi:hypothetical protein